MYTQNPSLRVSALQAANMTMYLTWIHSELRPGMSIYIPGSYVPGCLYGRLNGVVRCFLLGPMYIGREKRQKVPVATVQHYSKNTIFLDLLPEYYIKAVKIIQLGCVGLKQRILYYLPLLFPYT